MQLRNKAHLCMFVLIRDRKEPTRSIIDDKRVYGSLSFKRFTYVHIWLNLYLSEDGTEKSDKKAKLV